MLLIRSAAPLMLLFALSMASASVTLPGDVPYEAWRGPQVLYVYDQDAKEYVAQIAAYLEAVRAGYDASFNWRLDEEEDLLLLSKRQQVANAFATITPNIKSIWYPGGSGSLEDMAESSWALTLTTHETSHLYQLNAKAPFPAELKTVFGNAPEVLFFALPVFIHPNLLTPTFLIEGNAVLNESRANIGGRLHSGEVRALVLAQIQAGEINPNRLINNEWRFPYGDNPYFQGAYFQAHLAAKYGVDKTNQFFLAQGDHWILPLILNRTFRKHFGSSYPQEIREYVREMEALAKNQRSTPGAVLSRAPYIGPLNHDATRVFFLTSDGLGLPKLEIFDKLTGRIVSRTQMDMPVGKVFYVDGQPESSDSIQHDLHHIEYSLYGDGDAFDARFRGQIVTDRRAGQQVALAGGETWLEPQVLLNGEPYDIGHSRPVLDDAGNVYYFRQNGSERVLYKNRQPVFKISGFYAKLTEVGADGSIYFIANTDYGATLYRHFNGETMRMLTSDRVVDARLVQGDRFLVTEVYPAGHEIKIAVAKPMIEEPAVYAYGFPSYNLMPGKLHAPEQIQMDARPYNSLRELRYSRMDLQTTYDSHSGLGGLIGAHFADPLEYQNIDLGAAGTQFRARDAYFHYTYTRFLPQVQVGYVDERDSWAQYNSAQRTSWSQLAEAGADLPVLKWRDWDADVTALATYHHRDNHADPSAPNDQWHPTRSVEETYGADTGARLHYEQDPSPILGMYPVREFTLTYANRLEAWSDGLSKAHNTSLVQTELEQSLGNQFYFTVTGVTAWAENHDVLIDYNPYPLNDDTRISRLTAHDYYQVEAATAARLEVTKVFDFPSYSPRIPIGIDRIAPVLIAQDICMDSNGSSFGRYPGNAFEWAYGVDFQLLIAHLAHVKTRFIFGFDTARPNDMTTQAELAYSYRF